MPDFLSFKQEFQDTGIVTDIKSWCFGKDPIVSPQQVIFAGGGNKFSFCAGYTMTCPKNKKYPTLKVVFCAKLRSHIFHRDPGNLSRWYLWQPLGNSGCLVMDTDKCEKEYGFDFYKFYRTGLFKKGQEVFSRTIANGIRGASKLYGEMDKEDQSNFQKYIDSLSEARDIVTQTPEVNEKSYSLIDYDKFIADLKKAGYTDELEKRIEILSKYNDEIGKRFMDKVKKNELKPGEMDRALDKLNSTFGKARFPTKKD